MKKQLLLFAVFCLCIVLPSKAEAKGVLIYNYGEALKNLHELPADVQIDGKHVNLGIHYESFGLFWMPVWNYGDYKWALVNDAEDTWWELSAEEVQSIAKEYNLGKLPERPSLPLLTQIGLKPILLIILLFMLYNWFSPDKKEEKESYYKQQSDK